jgi:hypothetical protein
VLLWVSASAALINATQTERDTELPPIYVE